MTLHTTTRQIDLTLLIAGDDDCAVPSTFRYDPSDPYAVRVAMSFGGALVEWLMSRELLQAGLLDLAGIGDVCVHPGFDERGEAIVHLELSCPDGDAVLLVPAAELEQFLQDSYRVIPVGAETDHLDLDAALAELLTGC